MVRLPTRRGARLGAPGGNRRVREPDREAAALAQGGIILSPVGDPMSLLGNVAAVGGIDLERHGKIREPGQGMPSYPASSQPPTCLSVQQGAHHAFAVQSARLGAPKALNSCQTTRPRSTTVSRSSRT